jgi:hypothetical protein
LAHEFDHRLWKQHSPPVCQRQKGSTLVRLACLRELNLFSNEVTSAGLAHLQGMGSLLELDLSNTPVADAGLLHLAKLTGLRRLRVKGTLITDAGIGESKLALPKLTIER